MEEGGREGNGEGKARLIEPPVRIGLRGGTGSGDQRREGECHVWFASLISKFASLKTTELNAMVTII